MLFLITIMEIITMTTNVEGGGALPDTTCGWYAKMLSTHSVLLPDLTSNTVWATHTGEELRVAL